MTANIAGTLSAYANTAARDGAASLAPRDEKVPGTDFASLVKDAASSAIAAGQRSEQVTMEALAGQADLTEVVVAVTNAEVTLQTVVAIRDRVIQAYQEIIRMPL